MARASRMQTVSMNDTAALKFTGFMESFGMNIGKSRYIGPVMRYAFERMDQQFTMEMSKLALGAPDSYHHVYEWNALGADQARLWETQLVGEGSRRSVTFSWRPSRTAVPLPEPLPKEGPKGQQLQGGHIFTWKAPMMEYQMDVTIAPEMSNYLAFIANDIKMAPHRNSLWFTKTPQHFNGPPNSRNAAGKFTAAFLNWWGGGGADSAFNNAIKEQIEDGLQAKIAGKVKTFRMNAAGAPVSQGARARALAQGKKEALDFLEDNSRDYIGRAARSRNRGEGGRFTGKRWG